MPIFHPRLTLIHKPKTGGSWASNVLERRGAYLDDDHDPAWCLPAVDRGRPIVGIARDPWTWYRSLFLHMQRINGCPALYTWGHLQGREASPSWPTVLEGFLSPRRVQELRGGLMHGFVSLQGRRLARASLLDYGGGLWSWSVAYWFGASNAWDPGPGFRWGVDELWSTAALASQLGAALGEDLSREVGVGANMRPTGQRVPAEYTAEQDAQIREVDAWGLELLGMNGPGAPVHPLRGPSTLAERIREADRALGRVDCPGCRDWGILGCGVHGRESDR